MLRMRYADARDASRKSTWIDDGHPPQAAQAREASRSGRMDDRRRSRVGEGSPRALCDHDSSTRAQGVARRAL